MPTITKALTSMTTWNGYDQNDHLKYDYIFFSNGIVVPSETVTAVAVSLTFTPYDRSDNNISSSLGSKTITNAYFSTSVGNGYGLGSPSGIQNTLSELSLLVYSSTYSGRTIYIGGVYETISSYFTNLSTPDADFDHCTLSGTVDFTTPSGTYTYTINTIPSDATKIIAGSSRSSYTAAEGTSFTWLCSKDGYTSQKKTVTMPSANMTITVYLRTLNGDFKWGSSNPSAIKVGSSDSPRVYMGNNLVWYKNTLGTTEINNSTITVKVTKFDNHGISNDDGTTYYLGSATTNVGKGASNINVISATGLLGATVTASTSYNMHTGVLTVTATSTNKQPVTVRISVMRGV